MPTRPVRRERRRADRRNANKGVSLAPHSWPNGFADLGPMSPAVFQKAAPVVRMVMRVVLIQTSFTISQVIGFELWKETLELRKPRRSAPTYGQCEYQISCFQIIIDLHYMHTQELEVLQLHYAKQVAMWGFECSKKEHEWDLGLIARRKLELAQLNRITKRLAMAFEIKLQALLENSRLFTTQTERKCLLEMMESFRDSFREGVEIADQETAATLKKSKH
ncbi:hypothetical protein OPT61_g5400 [Boeremia exigua]|uniref:Uncharacterized protein n=1 Tax=Boeremia exigua TaxID=749465 RepID=A0ACC2IAE1_9PLEO|nr:hypothetical protein OPT61_g5400 [Boeremia exigua]